MSLVEAILEQRKEIAELKARVTLTPENAQAYQDMALQINTIRDLLRKDHNLWVAMGPKLETLT